MVVAASGQLHVAALGLLLHLSSGQREAVLPLALPMLPRILQLAAHSDGTGAPLPVWNRDSSLPLRQLLPAALHALQLQKCC